MAGRDIKTSGFQVALESEMETIIATPLGGNIFNVETSAYRIQGSNPASFDPTNLNLAVNQTINVTAAYNFMNNLDPSWAGGTDFGYGIGTLTKTQSAYTIYNLYFIGYPGNIMKIMYAYWIDNSTGREWHTEIREF